MAKALKSSADAEELAERKSLFSEQEWVAIVGRLAFSTRKAEIVAMLLAGQKDETIAKALGIRKTTLRSHIGQLFRRLRVDSRLGLAIEIFWTYRQSVENRHHH